MGTLRSSITLKNTHKTHEKFIKNKKKIIRNIDAKLTGVMSSGIKLHI